MSGKVFFPNVDPERQVCIRCGSCNLDTGWECVDCDYDNMDHYYPPDKDKAP